MLDKNAVKDCAPVCLFVYARVDETRRVLEDLAHNRYACNTPFYVYSDGPKNDAHRSGVEQVRGQEIMSEICRLSGKESLTIGSYGDV